MLSEVIGHFLRIAGFFIGTFLKIIILLLLLPTKEAPKGRLIDLDLEKELDSMLSGACYWTGTM